MGFLDSLRNALQPAILPAGDSVQFQHAREDAYNALFGDEPESIIQSEMLSKTPGDVRVDLRIYDALIAQQRVTVVVTSGMSDYRMKLPHGGPIRRELIQYFRKPTAMDLARLHFAAWTPISSGFPIDCFHTTSGVPDEWPGAIFLKSLIRPHGNFHLDLAGDEMRLLWHVPLRRAELTFKVKHGVNALIAKMGEAELPWIFDAASRPPLITDGKAVSALRT